jgi:ubiquinone/menaquinone biosynthesis C-methylase UbiE
VSNSLVDLNIGYADALPFGDNSVNVVYLSLVLMHVPEERVEKCITEAVRVSSKLVVILDEYRPLPTGVLSCKINDFTVAHNHLLLIKKLGFSHQSFEVYDKWVVITVKKLC